MQKREKRLRLSTKATSQEESQENLLDRLEVQILPARLFEGVALKDISYGYGEETSLRCSCWGVEKQHKTITAAAESLTVAS